MILNVGGRTDIVNHYGDWLMNRFRAGYVCLRNPLFPNKVIRYELTPEKVDAVLFCSKNYAPFLPHVTEISSKYRTYFHYTITAYGKDLEPNIPSAEESVETLLRLSSAVGKEKVGWRYAPVLITERYSAECHLQTFEKLARMLSGKIDRCFFGFLDMQRKTSWAIPTLHTLSPAEKHKLASEFAAIASSYRIPLRICQEEGYEADGVEKTGCFTLDVLGRANDCTFREIKHNGNRHGCACIESRDVGAYETCPNLCKYCYANTDAKKVAENRKVHDVNSPLLIGNIKETDILMQGIQDSYLKDDGRQISLFELYPRK